MRTIIFFFLFLVVACRQTTTKEMTKMNTQLPSENPMYNLEVRTFLENYRSYPKGEALLLDVRTPPEFDDGYITGAILINYLEDDIDQQLNMFDKSKTYFVYCQNNAGRSAKCMDKMYNMGFIKVYNLLGGYEGYQQAEIK